MKTLKFRQNLAEEVMAGRKTVTWRLFDDKDLKVGDDISLLVWEDGKEFAKGKITETREKKLSEITQQDFEGHEKFSSSEEMLETYQKYYGEKVDWNTIVKIIKFKLL